MDNSTKNIKIAFLLNIFFSILELIGGIFTNSISIISDSVHDFGDALSIGIAMLLEKKSKKKPDNNYTYGYTRYSLLGALITSVILLIGSVLVIYNVIPRLLNPTQVSYDGMIILAIIGVLINGIATYKTARSNNLNEKAVSLHMLEDVLGWIAVLIGSIIIKFTGLYIIDPIISIIITVFILFNVIKNIKEIFLIFLEKSPKEINISAIKEDLSKIESVKDIHHIHLWSIDSLNNFLTLHCLVDDKVSKQEVEEIKKEIRLQLEKNNIKHSTIEIEYVSCDNKNCNIDCDEHHDHHHHH